MIKDRSEKVIVHIIYPCFVCAEEFSTASLVIHHVKNVHGYVLIPRPTGHHRPQDKHYDYEPNLRNKWDVQHYGCPSCWFHAPKNMESIMEHVMKVHEPKQIEGFVHKGEDDEDELFEEDESDQEVANKEKRVSFQEDTPKDEEEQRQSDIDDVNEKGDGAKEVVEQQHENDVNDEKKEDENGNDNSESTRNNNEASPSPESATESQQDLMKQIYEKVFELSIALKSVVDRTI